MDKVSAPGILARRCVVKTSCRRAILDRIFRWYGCGGLDGHCEAYIERVTGGYSFEGVWTLPWGKATRCHILTYGRFQLFKGNRISFCDEDSRGSEKSFRTICRYVAFINRHAKEYGISPIWLGHPYHCHALWRGMAVGKDGFTRDGVAGPEPKGLSAIVDTAIALGVLEDEDAA